MTAPDTRILLTGATGQVGHELRPRLATLGKLIPAGTGMPQYRNIRVEPTEEAKNAMYATFANYDELDYSGFATNSGAAVPLEDFDVRGYNA